VSSATFKGGNGRVPDGGGEGCSFEGGKRKVPGGVRVVFLKGGAERSFRGELPQSNASAPGKSR